MKFFVLNPTPTGENESTRTDFVHRVHSTIGEAPQCDLCEGYIGMRTWLPPYRVDIETWGRQFGDFAFFGTLGSFLASERFQACYQQNGLTGLRTVAPVEVVKIKRHKKLPGSPPLYFKVDVTHSETAIDLKASGFEWTTDADICPRCLMPRNALLKRYSGLVINQDTWRGEDIFIPRGGTDFAVSERFKSVCTSNQIQNATFILSEIYRVDLYPWDKT